MKIVAMVSVIIPSRNEEFLLQDKALKSWI